MKKSKILLFAVSLGLLVFPCASMAQSARPLGSERVIQKLSR